jgi:hypothetical protein
MKQHLLSELSDGDWAALQALVPKEIGPGGLRTVRNCLGADGGRVDGLLRDRLLHRNEAISARGGIRSR